MAKDRPSDVDSGWTRPQTTLIGTGKGTEHDPASTAEEAEEDEQETKRRAKHVGTTLVDGSPSDEEREEAEDEEVIEEVSVDATLDPGPASQPPRPPPPKNRASRSTSGRPAPPKPPRKRDSGRGEERESASRRPPPRRPRSEPPPRPKEGAPRAAPVGSRPPPPRPPRSEPPSRPEDAAEEIDAIAEEEPTEGARSPQPSPAPQPAEAPRAPTPSPRPAAPKPSPQPAAPRAPAPSPQPAAPSPTPAQRPAPPPRPADFAPPAPPAFELPSVQETCRGELRGKVEGARLARLHHELARTAPTRSEARKHYDQALQAAPDHLPSIRGAREVCLAEGKIKRAAELFDAEIRLAPGKRRKAVLAFEKGCAYLDAGKADHARNAFAEAAEIDDGWLVALRAHIHRELVAKDYGNLDRAYAREAAAISQDRRHRAALVAHRARLLERRLRREDDAVEQLQEALDLDAYTPAALADLARLLYGQRRWRELVSVLEREASLTDDPAVQSRAWWSIARIQAERLDSREEAIGALEAASRISERDPQLLEELARLNRATGDRTGEAAALERLAAVARPHDRLGVYLRLGRLFDRPDGDTASAIRWYEAALALQGAFEPALRALDSLYGRAGRHRELATMYARAGEADAGSAVRAGYHARAAEVLDAELGEADEAVEHYRRALALDRGHEGAFKALVRLFTQGHRHRELIELYDRAVDGARSEDVAIAYLFKIGSIHEDVLGELSAAVSTYERILERQNDHLGALHALQRAGEAAGAYDKVVEALDREASLEKDRGRVTALAHRAAEIVADRLGDTEEALRRLERLSRKSPKFQPALSTLGRLYARLERHEDQLEVYERQLELLEEDRERVALLMEMAELCEERLGNRKRAVELFRRVVDIDRTHALASAASQRLLRELGDFEQLAQLLSKQLAAAVDPVQRVHLALSLGDVHEAQLGRLDEAVRAYRQALEAVPGHRGALGALARVLGQQQAWKELDQVLDAEAQAAGDARLRIDAKIRSAIVRADRLHRNESAAELLEEVVGEDPQNLAALIVLETLYATEEDHERLGDVLGQEAEVLAEPAARVAALVHRGRQLEATGDDAALRSICTAIVAIDPENTWALEALARIARATPDPHLLADVEARLCDAASDPGVVALHATRLGDALRQTNPSAALSAYRRAADQQAGLLSPLRGLHEVGFVLGDIATVVEAYQREAAWLSDDRSAADLLVQAGALQAQRGDFEGAVRDAEAALRRCPDHVHAAEQVVAMLRQAGRTDELLETLTQAAHAASDESRRVALWRQVGSLHADEREDLGAAISALTRALEVRPNDLETVLRLASLHARDQQHDEAAALLTRAVELDPKAIEAHRELARIYTHHRPDPTKAKKSLDVVLDHDPEDQDALAMQLRLKLGGGDRAGAREVSERLLEVAGDDDDTRAWALAEIGRMESEAGDEQRAAEALHQAVAIEGPTGRSAERYRQLLGGAEPWDRWVSALRAHLQRNPGDPASVYLAIANAQHEKMREPQRALSTLEEAIGRHPERLDVALARADLLDNAGRNAEAADAYRGVLARSPRTVSAWRGLVRSMQQQGRPSEAALAAGALVAIGEAADIERNLAREAAPRPGSARPGSLAHPTLRTISAGSKEDDERLAELFAAHADGIAKAFPPNYALYGLRKGDRIKPRTHHPIRQEIDRIAPAFGIEDFELYVHAGLGGDVTIELSDPPSLMVPTYFSDLPDAQLVFLLGRPLAAVAAGLHPAYKLPPEEVAAMVAAAVRRLVPGFEEGMHDPDRLAALGPHLSPSWFGRGRVDEAAQRYYAEPTDVRTWAPTARFTATRAAALLAGDFGACVEALRTVGEAEGKDGPLIDDLLRFWLGDEALEVRRLAGMS